MSKLSQWQREIISDLEEMRDDRGDISVAELRAAIEYVKTNGDKYDSWEDSWDAADDALACSGSGELADQLGVEHGT